MANANPTASGHDGMPIKAARPHARNQDVSGLGEVEAMVSGAIETHLCVCARQIAGVETADLQVIELCLRAAASDDVSAELEQR